MDPWIHRSAPGPAPRFRSASPGGPGGTREAAPHGDDLNGAESRDLLWVNSDLTVI